MFLIWNNFRYLIKHNLIKHSPLQHINNFTNQKPIIVIFSFIFFILQQILKHMNHIHIFTKMTTKISLQHYQRNYKKSITKLYICVYAVATCEIKNIFFTYNTMTSWFFLVNKMDIINLLRTLQINMIYLNDTY